MSWLGRFFLWKAKRRHARRQRWLRDSRITFTFTSPPRQDSRAWSDAYMNSVKKDQR